MAYLGLDPQVAYSSYRNIDDISGSFDGTTTSFVLKVNGVAPGISPINEQQVLINVGGVPQQPDPSGAKGFKLSAGNVVFSSAPAAGESFWGVILASANYISANTRFADGSANLPSVTFASDVTTGIYSPGLGQLAIGTGGSGRLFVDANGKILVGTSVASGSALFQVAGDTQVQSLNGGQLAGMRNRIINGGMQIDQWNAGASVTPTAGQYVLDRWRANSTQASKYSVQQNAGSVTPPSGFTAYLGITSLSAYAVTGNDSFLIEQIIEGFNVSDLAWGTASAKAATLSFWVSSSLTGTFGGSIATTKTAIWVMPFTYSIASANTWTYITVSIPAPTSTGGTNNDNSSGVFVRFGLGATGTSTGGTAGTWTSAGNYVQPSGTVSVVGTNGATLYITGVQLEPGTIATPFERRSYGQELALCQRYYETGSGVLLAAFSGGSFGGGITNYQFKATKRATPTTITTAAGVGTGLVTTFQVATLNDRVAIWWNGSALQGDYRDFTFTASAEF
jgi:hypothetical protein